MATNQQPNQPRPWLRLTSLAARTNIPTPGPAPAPAPGPAPAPVLTPILRPALRPHAQQPQALAAVAPPAVIRPTFRPPAPAKAPAPEAKPTEPRPDQAGIQLAHPPPTSPVKPPTNGAIKAITPTSPPKPVAAAPTNGVSTVTPPTSPPKPAAAPPPTISSLKSTSSPTGRISASEKASPTALSRSLKPTAESPPHSPPRKTTALPPSPLTLPPAQLKSQEKLEPPFPMEAEQKTVLVQKTVGKPSNSHLDGKHEPTMKHADKKEKAHHKKPSSDSDETGVRVITIAGENIGAFMELIKSPRQKIFEGHPHHLQKKANGKSLSDAGSEYHSYSSSDEAKQHKRDMHHKTLKAPSPMNAYMNSNVQGINNSIVYNSSHTHRDPGVHVAFSKKPSGSGVGLYGTEHTNVE